MQVRNTHSLLSKLRALSIVLSVCLLALSGCKSKTSEQEQGPGPTENARKSGAAERASKAALVGTWRLTSAPHDVGGLRDIDVDFLNASDEIVRAGFEFRDNGEVTVLARFADNALQSRDGTWKLGEVDLNKFNVDLDFEGASALQTITIEPRADGNLDAILQDRRVVLRKRPLDDYLKISDK